MGEEDKSSSKSGPRAENAIPNLFLFFVVVTKQKQKTIKKTKPTKIIITN